MTIAILMTCIYIYYICNDLMYGFCFYLIGILFALHLSDIRVHIDNRLFIFLFLLSSMAIVIVGYYDRIVIIFEIVSAICLWFAIPILPDSYTLNLDISFLIYETHEIIFSSVFKLLYIILPLRYVFAYINYVLTIFIGLSITYYVFSFINRISNRFYSLIGGR